MRRKQLQPPAGEWETFSDGLKSSAKLCTSLYVSKNELPDKPAEVGNASDFHAADSISRYTEQLESIFRTLGNKRPAKVIG